MNRKTCAVKININTHIVCNGKRWKIMVSSTQTHTPMRWQDGKSDVEYTHSYIQISESVHCVYTHCFTVWYCDWIKNNVNVTRMNMNSVGTHIYICIWKCRNKVILKPRVYWWMRAAMILSLFLPITVRHFAESIPFSQPLLKRRATEWNGWVVCVSDRFVYGWFISFFLFAFSLKRFLWPQKTSVQPWYSLAQYTQSHL